jgi:hypothetical protein
MKTIPQILDYVRLNIMWPVFTGLAVIMFIYAGILFITANGDPGKIDTAKKAVVWGVVGIIVGILGYSVVGIIKQAIGA